AATYAHADVLTLDYAVADACVGVKTQTALLDGATTVAGHGLADGQAIDLLTELALGPHTFRLEATDLLSNASATAVSFTVVATADGLVDAVRRFGATGGVRDPGTDDALAALARAAAGKHEAGDCRNAATHYDTFIKNVQK